MRNLTNKLVQPVQMDRSIVKTITTQQPTLQLQITQIPIQIPTLIQILIPTQTPIQIRIQTTTLILTIVLILIVIQM